jgi:Photosynthetic reaction centre cytochrome C subunit
MNLLILAVTVLTLSGLGAAPQDKAPDLSGIWRSNPQKSHNSGGQPTEDTRLKIDQKGSDIAIIWISRSKGVDDVSNFRYRIGASDNPGELHGGSMKSDARWDGDVLAVDSVVMYGTDPLRLNDRWTLSPDGQTLTFDERHQFKDEPAGENVIVFERQLGAVWEPPGPPKPAEEVYKNIQVLKGVPASRVPAVMMFFSKSLGVDCSHCHIVNEFEKDDKPAKLMARRMLNMVHKINADNFPDKQLISCWTCHRGNVKPESFPK